jgi:hypothetical protein
VNGKPSNMKQLNCARWFKFRGPSTRRLTATVLGQVIHYRADHESILPMLTNEAASWTKVARNLDRRRLPAVVQISRTIHTVAREGQLSSRLMPRLTHAFVAGERHRLNPRSILCVPSRLQVTR